MSAYSSEQDLVNDLLHYLAQGSPWGDVLTGSEFFYQRGKTDVIAVNRDGRVIAFEAKLAKWRDALHQAYRNTCLAHWSYVVLPKDVAMRAYDNIEAFERRRVGICYVEATRVVVLWDAVETSPLQPWLSEKAAMHVKSARDRDARS
jgi:hypothetical protein